MPVLTGDGKKVRGVGAICVGTRGLLAGIPPGTIHIPPEENFRFDPVAVAEIKTGAEWLRAALKARDLQDKHAPAPAAGEFSPRKDKLSLALGVLAVHPQWSARRIAREVGCSGAYLSSCSKWRAAREAIKGIGQEGQHKAPWHRGHDMDEYAADAEGQPPAGQAAGPVCASKGCGDPAGVDAAGKPLLHAGKPYRPECWAEMRQGR